jgi:hypothetical protein
MPKRDVATRTADPSGTNGAGLGNTTGGQVFKFLIGFIASVCAVFLPKLLVYLKNDDGTLEAPSIGYMIAGLVFAAIVGFVILLFEWGKRSKPAEVFMTALGIPALVSGTLGTVGTADNLKQEVEQRRTFMAEIAKNAGVNISDQPITLSPSAAQPQSRLFEIVPTARADAFAPIIVAQSAYGVQAARRQFLVVILDTPDQRLANARASAVRGTVANVSVVQSGGHFYVATSSSPMTEQDALAQALQLQRQGITTSLVPVKN